jgi:ubiquinone biosynthesis protein
LCLSNRLSLDLLAMGAKQGLAGFADDEVTMNPVRAENIARAVEVGIERWSQSGRSTPAAATVKTTEADVLRSMPRRRLVYTFDPAASTLPMVRHLSFRPGIIQPALRLLVWLRVCIYFFGGNSIDFLRGRDSLQRRAIRLRRLFDAAGGSFGKLAQQLAQRADLLPYAYCVELSKILDQAPVIATADALALIEQELGRPFGEVFALFDPIPIGSASIACVYQAQLRSGENVAVKVQRPGIGQKLSADLRALDWLLGLAEALTIVRPGLTRSFRRELRTMILGELNFRTEARFTEMFRLRAKNCDEGITAPKIYFEYCSERVLVSELVSGVWMWELMAAVDQNDGDFLAKIAAMGIEPKSIATKLINMMHRDVLEEIFFHADPHPANIVVQPNNRICFIDFGAVGRFSTQTRNTWREINAHLKNGDIERMAVSSIALGGPLPPIDVDRLLAAVEEIFTEWLYASKSTDAEWWERSNATNWLRFISVARKFGIPANLETIQFFRGTLLYDSIIMRLNKDVEFDREWKSYAKTAGTATRGNIQNMIRKRFSGPGKIEYLSYDRAFDVARRFVSRLGLDADNPVVHFKNVAGKISYVTSVLMRVGSLGIVAAAVIVAADQMARLLIGGATSFFATSWFAAMDTMWSSPTLQLILLVVAIVVVRRIFIRLKGPDKVRKRGQRWTENEGQY